MSNRFYFWVGVAFLIYLPCMLGWHLYHAPGRWHLGLHGVPIPLEGELPGYYADGTPMNKIDCLILQSGEAELIYGVLFGSVIVAVIWFILVVCQARKLKREADQLLKELEHLLTVMKDGRLAKERLQQVQRSMSWNGHPSHENG